VGVVLTVVAGIILLAVGVRYFFKPRFEEWLRKFEGQGWFNAVSYK
jgi:hypothetical protein